MTVQEFLTRFDADHENNITQEQKIRWLKRIELLVMSEIMLQHSDYDKPGMPRNIIRYEYDNAAERLIDDKGMDISDTPELYIDNDTLTLTSYDIRLGKREADDFGMDTFLQIPEPYDTVYEYYLEMQIAHVNGNTVDYNRKAAMYNEAFRTFNKYYNRTYRSNAQRSHLLRHEVL